MPDGFWHWPADIYGFVVIGNVLLSAALACLQIVRMSQDRPRLKATIEPLYDDQSGRLYGLRLTVTNSGRRGVTISDVGYRLRGHREFVPWFGAPHLVSLCDNETYSEELPVSAKEREQIHGFAFLCLKVSNRRVMAIRMRSVQAENPTFRPGASHHSTT